MRVWEGASDLPGGSWGTPTSTGSVRAPAVHLGAAQRPRESVHATHLSPVPVRSLRRLWRRLATSVMLVVAVGCVSLGVVMRIGHLHAEPVLSGSMRPAMQPGDLVVAKRTSTTTLRVGDVIAFFAPNALESPLLRPHPVRLW